jgi:two-component system, OmpR family, response regulator
MDEPTATKASATKRVLIVDDEPDVLAVLRDCFAAFRHGHAYEVTTAESAADAFTLLRRERFDLILLDIVMPAEAGRWISERKLGLGLLGRFRDLGVSAPVIMMTGGWGETAKEEALNAGVAGFLYKPIDLRELDDAVARVLRSGAR